MVQILPEYGTKDETLFGLKSDVGAFVRNLRGCNPNAVVTSRRCIVFSQKWTEFRFCGVFLETSLRPDLESEEKHIFSLNRAKFTIFSSSWRVTVLCPWTISESLLGNDCSLTYLAKGPCQKKKEKAQARLRFPKNETKLLYSLCIVIKKTLHPCALRKSHSKWQFYVNVGTGYCGNKKDTTRTRSQERLYFIGLSPLLIKNKTNSIARTVKR